MKAKKVLLVIGIVLVALVGIAIGVCFVVFPTQSKEVFEKFKTIITQPLPIIGVSVVVLVGGILTIISKTTIGSAYLTKLREVNTQLKNDYELKIKEVKDKTVEFKVLLEEYKTKAEYYEGVILEICDTIPNKKVNDIATKIREYDSNVKEEAETKVFNEMVENIKQRINEAYNAFVCDLTDEQKVAIADKYLEVVKQYKELMEKVEGLTIDTISQFDYEEVIALWQRND